MAPKTKVASRKGKNSNDDEKEGEAFWSAMASPNNASFFFASFAGNPEQPLPALRHNLQTPLALAAVEINSAPFLEVPF